MGLDLHGFMCIARLAEETSIVGFAASPRNFTVNTSKANRVVRGH